MVMWPFENKKKQVHISAFVILIGVILMTYKESIQIASFVDTFILGIFITFAAVMYFFDAQ